MVARKKESQAGQVIIALLIGGIAAVGSQISDPATRGLAVLAVTGIAVYMARS